MRSKLLLKKEVEKDPEFNKVRINNDKYVIKPYGSLGSMEYRLAHRDHSTLLTYLQYTAVRRPNNYDLGLHSRFWKHGYLVSSKSLRDLAASFGYKSLSQIRAMLRKLKINEEIYIEEVDVGKNTPQHVYVIGIHNGRLKEAYEELYFTDLKFSKKLNDKKLDSYLLEFGVNKKLINWS